MRIGVVERSGSRRWLREAVDTILRVVGGRCHFRFHQDFVVDYGAIHVTQKVSTRDKHSRRRREDELGVTLFLRLMMMLFRLAT